MGNTVKDQVGYSVSEITMAIGHEVEYMMPGQSWPNYNTPATKSKGILKGVSFHMSIMHCVIKVDDYTTKGIVISYLTNLIKIPIIDLLRNKRLFKLTMR